jgi:hypothetical protein
MRSLVNSQQEIFDLSDDWNHACGQWPQTAPSMLIIS